MEIKVRFKTPVRIEFIPEGKYLVAHLYGDRPGEDLELGRIIGAATEDDAVKLNFIEVIKAAFRFVSDQAEVRFGVAYERPVREN